MRVARAKIADGPNVRLVVDTGAGTSALGEACASRLGLPVRRTRRVRTASGQGGVGTLAVRGHCLGPLEFAGFRLTVVPLPDTRVDGLLGLDFFRAVGARSLALELGFYRCRLAMPPHRASGWGLSIVRDLVKPRSG